MANKSKGVLIGIITPASPSKEFITLTDGAIITWDVSASYNAQVTLTANRVLGTPSNVTNGDYGTLKIIQDGTGGHGLSLPATFKVVSGGAGAVSLTAAGGSTDILSWVYDGTNFWLSYGTNFD